MDYFIWLYRSTIPGMHLQVDLRSLRSRPPYQAPELAADPRTRHCCAAAVGRTCSGAHSVTSRGTSTELGPWSWILEKILRNKLAKLLGNMGKYWQTIRKIIGKHGKQMGELDVPLCGLWGCIWMYQKRSKPILPDSWERTSIFTSCFHLHKGTRQLTLICRMKKRSVPHTYIYIHKN